MVCTQYVLKSHELGIVVRYFLDFWSPHIKRPNFKIKAIQVIVIVFTNKDITSKYFWILY